MATVISTSGATRIVHSHTMSLTSEHALPVLLDDVFQRFHDIGGNGRQVRETMEGLFLGLERQRDSTSQAAWQTCIDACRRHPVRHLVHQDPFTYRAYSKPRGYAGDAELLDYIYGREEQWPSPAATPLGHLIFDYTTLAPAAEGVRARRGYIANLIDRLTEEDRNLEILSVAAGHLREANLCAAIKRRRFRRFVALDTDALSLKEVERSFSCYGVEVVAANVRRLITGKLALGQFDLAYSTGLFDYVGAAAGRRLTAVLFGLLRSGGRLVVANFLPGIRDAGYMEAFMDWRLIYRTREQMMDLTMEIPQQKIRDIRIFAEENQNIIFVQVRKV